MWGSLWDRLRRWLRQPAAPAVAPHPARPAPDGLAGFEPRAAVLGPRSQQMYVPDTVVDGWSSRRFQVRAASVRGDRHRRGDVPRQDAFIVTHHPGTGAVLVAVADGVSNARLAHDGAFVACRYAVASILEMLDQGCDPDLVTVVERSASALIELGRRLGGEPGPQAAGHLYATTLVLLVAWVNGPALRVSAASVGDSAIWSLDGPRLRRVIGGKDHEPGELFSAAVEALPYLPEKINAVRTELGPREALLVMTDGIGDPLGDGTGTVGELLADRLRTPPSPLEMAAVAGFPRPTFTDDRTLVAVWARPDGAPGTAHADGG